MKRSFTSIIFSLFLICFVSISYANDPVNRELQSEFFGTWHYPKNDIYYTISEDYLVAYMPGDDEGFTVRITSWEYIENEGSNSNTYPNGFLIRATMEKMTGSWWLDIGESDIWFLFLNKDKNSFITEDDVIYFRSEGISGAQFTLLF